MTISATAARFDDHTTNARFTVANQDEPQIAASRPLRR